jgi:hypothetical protein
MRPSLIIALSAVLAIATVGAGLVEGRWSNRWGEPADLASAGTALENVPKRVGDWEAVSSEPFSDDVAQMLECSGNFTRVYQNMITGEQVNVAMLVGPPGPTAVHTPEICYSSRDHQVSERRTVVQMNPQADPGSSLWKLTFRSNDLEQSLLRVYYGWHGADGSWQASDNPRFEFGGQSLLYKIQLAGRMPADGSTAGDDSVARFLQDFLPAVDAALFQNL